jgi:hypothetical protein
MANIHMAYTTIRRVEELHANAHARTRFTPGCPAGPPRPASLKILAQRKQVNFVVNYLQSTARDIARQYIKRAVVQNQAKMMEEFGLKVTPYQ